MRFLPQLLGNGWGWRVGVEMGTYWRPTVPNPHASPMGMEPLIRLQNLSAPSLNMELFSVKTNAA